MKLIHAFLFILFCSFILSCKQEEKIKDFSQYETLKSGFADPQGTSRVKVYWWWLNGNTDSLRLKEELVAIKNAGLGGVDIFEIGFRPEGGMKGGPAFMSDASLDYISLAIREAGKLNLEVGLNLSSSWNAGGSWITPQHSAKSLYYSTAKAKGGESIVRIPFPAIEKIDPLGKPRMIDFAVDGKPVYRQEIAVLAFPAGLTPLDTSKIINVSRFLDAEKDILNWPVPEGDWDIQRFVCSSSGEQLKLPSPNSHGAIIDHFDSSATEFHFMYFINRLKPRIGDFSKSALKNLYLASFEATGTVWTPTLSAKFKALNGYDVDKFLPQLFNKDSYDQKTSETFRRDFDLTLSELMINNHYKKGKEICNRYGLQLISESGGPGPPLHNVPVEGIKALGKLDVPRGEYWVSHSRYDHLPDSIDLLMLVKEVSAAAHTYQRKIVELEAFTSGLNWQESPVDLRPIGDRAFTEGMNRLVIHGFTHNPRGFGLPGIGYYAGTHYNDKTTWWPKIKPFNDYLARVSFIAQETQYVADVLYYYGDKVPNFVVPKNTRFAVGPGYEYEVINTEKLLSDLTVENGMLALPYGARFKVLALGEIHGKDPKVLKKLEELAAAGAVITGVKPLKAIGESQLIADKLWNYGKIKTQSPLELLKAQNLIPDFDYPDKLSERLDYQHESQPAFDFIHYRKGDLDFYFVRNTHDETISRLLSFRQHGKTPEIWDPATGEIIPVSIYNEKDNHTDLPMTFAAYASYFIVFKAPSTEPHFSELKSEGNPPLLQYSSRGVEFQNDGEYTLVKNSKEEKIRQSVKTTPVEGDWNVSFSKALGGPESTTFNSLASWTESTDPGIKYYSGKAVYTKTLHYEASSGRVYLDLGRVNKVADAWLNDKHLGITWTMPYRYDVTDIIKPGENTLKVEVINTWSNRIIGDVGSKKPITETNLLYRGSRDRNGYGGDIPWSETKLIPSGILGPVTVISIANGN